MQDHIYLKSFILGESISMNKSLRDQASDYLTVRQTYELYSSTFFENDAMNNCNEMRGSYLEECIYNHMLMSEHLPFILMIKSKFSTVELQIKEMKKRLIAISETIINVPKKETSLSPSKK
jgi:hypothetical protein